MSAERPARRRLPWWAKGLLAVGSPVVFLCLVEGVLALAGYQPPQPPAFYERFPARKRAGTRRILVVGGSSAAGYPLWTPREPRGGPVALLRELLRDVAPRQQTEVVNCAVNALTSDGVAALVRRLLRYEPDVLIVYSGHNEFYRDPLLERVVASWDPQPPGWWRRTRTLSLLGDMALLVRGGAPAEPITRGERAAAGQIGAPADYQPGALAPHYAACLGEILDDAARARVAVVLSTLASNLRDVPPLRPKHREGLGAKERDDWESHFQQGRALARAGRHDEALAAFARAEAKRLFAAARDQDYNPMRATTPINAAARAAATSRRAALADAEEAFAAASPNGLPGDELFLDKVHLSPQGAMVLATCWARALEAGGLLGEGAGWDWSRARPREAYDRALGLDASFLAAAHAEIGAQQALSEAGGRAVADFRRPQFLEATRERGRRHFAEALRLDPGVVERLLAGAQPYARCYIADAFLALGHAGRAVEICERTLDQVPRLVLAYEVAERAYAAAGAPDKAEAMRRIRARLEGGDGPGGGAPQVRGGKEPKR